MGCRQRAAKSELIRLVWNGAVMLDVTHSAPGRGAYLHRRPECLDQAVRKRAVGRALRVPSVDGSQLSDVVGSGLERTEAGT